jgi:hypothetical protein
MEKVSVVKMDRGDDFTAGDTDFAEKTRRKASGRSRYNHHGKDESKRKLGR